MAITFTLQFDLPGFDKRISNLSKTIQVNVFKALQQGMELTVGVAQTKYMTGPRPEKLAVVTGLLRSSVKAGAYLGGEEGAFATGVLTAGQSGTIKYAAIHEYGGTTPPHSIVAKNVRNLKFFWKKKGIWFLGPRVNHPGSVIPARPYLMPAMKETARPGGIIDMMIRKAIDNAFKES
jgi:hypothetical protein